MTPLSRLFAIVSALTLPLLVLVPATVSAQGFEVAPIPVESVAGRATTVRITNPSASPLYVEASLMEWSRDERGVETMRESTRAQVSPPAFWVNPNGGTQIMRLALPQAPDGEEIPFRLVLQQVPNRDAIAAGRIVMAVRQVIPVFSMPDRIRPPSLSGRASGDALLIFNEGGRRVRVSRVSQDNRVLASGLVGYALAGTVSRMDVRGVRPGRIQLETDVGPMVLDVR